MAWFVAFYSYKGGVGRSMALANTAYALAQRGKRVLVVDLDLEAPSLDLLPDFKPLKTGPVNGFLEYATHYVRTGECPPIEDHVHPCPRLPVTGSGAGTRDEEDGLLWILPAGSRGESYGQTLHALDWRRLHPQLGTLPFVDGFRKAVTEAFLPHYVLIDSRTGLSDIGGLTTHILADEVVLVSNLSRACLEGTVLTHRSMCASDTSRGHPRMFFLVASMVPPGSEPLVEDRLQRTNALLLGDSAPGRPPIRVDYDASMALREDLAVRDPDRWSLAPRYERIRERLQRDNPDEVFETTERALSLRAEGRLDLALDEIRQFTSAHPENADGHAALGNLLLESGMAVEAKAAFRRAVAIAPRIAWFRRRLGEAMVSAKDYKDAVQCLDEARKAGDRSHGLYRALAEALDHLDHPREAADARREALLSLLGDADPDEPRAPEHQVREDFVRVLAGAPPLAGFDAGRFWDLTMGSLSLTPDDKRRLLRRVAARKISPKELARTQRELEAADRNAQMTYGPGLATLLSRLRAEPVNVRREAEIQRLLRGDGGDAMVWAVMARMAGVGAARAVELLQKATEIAPEDAHLWEMLGTAFLEKAVEEKGDAKIATLRQARQAHHRASELEPGWEEPVCGEGTALGLLAEAGDPKRASLLRESTSLLAVALRLKPDDWMAHNNRGAALTKLAEATSGSERDMFLRDACTHFREACRFKEDFSGALSNWGAALCDLADTAPAEEREPLLHEACKRSMEALHITPDSPIALGIWAASLLRLAPLLPAEAPALLAQARAHLLEADRLSPGSANYNLACVHARLGELDEADARLSAALSREPSQAAHALDDPDLLPLREARPDTIARLQALVVAAESSGKA